MSWVCKISWPDGRAGSSPAPSTNTKKINFNNDGSVAQLDRATPFKLYIILIYNYKRSASRETENVEDPLNDES